MFYGKLPDGQEIASKGAVGGSSHQVFRVLGFRSFRIYRES